MSREVSCGGHLPHAQCGAALPLEPRSGVWPVWCHLSEGGQQVSPGASTVVMTPSHLWIFTSLMNPSGGVCWWWAAAPLPHVGAWRRGRDVRRHPLRGGHVGESLAVLHCKVVRLIIRNISWWVIYRPSPRLEMLGSSLREGCRARLRAQCLLGPSGFGVATLSALNVNHYTTCL